MGKKKLNRDKELNLQDVLEKYVIQWKWFLLGVSICLIIAYIYLRYTEPQYQSFTTILVKDEKKGSMMSELSAFSDLGLTGAIKSNVDNEIEILKSRTLAESTVKKLNLNISLYHVGKFINNDLYENSPIEVNFFNRTKDFYTNKFVFNFVYLSRDLFQLEQEVAPSKSQIILTTRKKFRYGELIKTKYGDLIINRTNQNLKFFKENDALVKIQVNPLEDVTASFQSRLNVTSLSKTSSVVSLTFTSPVKKKSEDFLNNLVEIYNEKAVSDKNFISENTSKFISNRLKLISQELGEVEHDVENFKKYNNLTDINTEAKLYIEGSNEYNKKVLETEIQLNMIASMMEYIKKVTNSDLLPTNIITGENDASGLISSYNTLILDRNRILKTATLANPTVIKLDQQINSLKLNVIESLKRLQTNLNIQKKDLQRREEDLNSKIGKIPVQEHQYRVIARQQKVKEELYLYLLQKREETAISLSATVPNARVIDLAKTSKTPVSPKRSLTYLAAILLGLLIPFFVIYIISLLDTKIKSRLDLEGKTKIPFIGDIPTSTSPFEIMNSNSRTSSAEAFRIIRSNLEFMVNKDNENQARMFFVTSSFPQEGKTFVSANLAATFALSGKKVLLIGMDIRSPRLDKYFTIPNKGLTNYLSTNGININDLIIKQKGYDDFYVLPAGIIPPNPAELLMGKKVEELFESLKSQYDYIIVDTAPIGLVADTLLIAKYADSFIYVFRANFLGKRMLNIPNSLYKEKKLPNICLLLNDTDSTKGYGCGYGYKIKANKSWYEKFLKSN